MSFERPRNDDEKFLAFLDSDVFICGKQIGDPDRAALAILAAVRADDPPLHLLLGTDALRAARPGETRCRRRVDTIDELVLAFRAGVAVRGPFLIEVVL
jgi:hypothetical protein